MRTPGMGATVDMHRLDEFRDCLVNVDVQGGPIPSARFMGGREFEAIAEQSAFDVNADYPPASLLDRLPGLIESGARLLPSFVAGVGPFPASIGRWRNRPSEAIDRYVAAQLYLALMADVSIGLIGGRDRLLLEGRFATAVAFVRALATLRSDLEVYVSHAEHDVAYGALRLSDPDVAPPSVLTPVEPLELDLRAYGEKWRQEAGERPDQTDQALA
jgi:hypothetical protein